VDSGKVGAGVGDGVKDGIDVSAGMEIEGGPTGSVVTGLRAGICVGAGACTRHVFNLGCSSCGIQGMWFLFSNEASSPSRQVESTRVLG
jgi:hypothetical protein